MSNISNESQYRMTVLIECNEDDFVAELVEKFGNENVSRSSNFIGGVSIAVFIVSSIKLLQPMVSSILDFLSHRNDRYDDAHIVYDGKKIDIKGYSPDDVEKILNNPAFEKLHQ